MAGQRHDGERRERRSGLSGDSLRWRGRGLHRLDRQPQCRHREQPRHLCPARAGNGTRGPELARERRSGRHRARSPDLTEPRGRWRGRNLRGVDRHSEWEPRQRHLRHPPLRHGRAGSRMARGWSRREHRARDAEHTKDHFGRYARGHRRLDRPARWHQRDLRAARHDRGRDSSRLARQREAGLDRRHR